MAGTPPLITLLLPLACACASRFDAAYCALNTYILAHIPFLVVRLLHEHVKEQRLARMNISDHRHVPDQERILLQTTQIPKRVPMLVLVNTRIAHKHLNKYLTQTSLCEERNSERSPPLAWLQT